MSSNLLFEIVKDTIPVVSLDRLCSPKNRKRFGFIFGTIALLLLISTALIRISLLDIPTSFASIFSIILSFVGMIPGVDISNVDLIKVNLLPFRDIASISLVRGLHFWNGIMILSLSFYIIVKILNFFARSKYYVNLSLREHGKKKTISFLLKKIYINTKNGDLVSSFLTSDIAEMIMLRLGVTKKITNEYLANRIDVNNYENDDNLLNILTIEDLSKYLSNDRSLKEWLILNDIQDNDLVLATHFVENDYDSADKYDRYWGKVSLSKLSPIGENLSYGYGFYLKKYAYEISSSGVEFDTSYGGINVMKLEELLSRDNSANALLVSNSPHIAEDVVHQFAQDIVYHFKHRLLSHKRCFALDVQYFCNSNDSVESLNRELSLILEDAISAGNVIFVIPDFPSLLKCADRLGADMTGLLRPYLSGSELQIIAISDTAEYHSLILSNTLLSEFFHDIHIAEPENEIIFDLINNDIHNIEWKSGVFFTIQSIKQIISDAERTLVHGLLIDKIKEILNGIPAYLEKNKIKIVYKNNIDDFVSLHSDIKIGKASEEEQGQLLILEKTLHESVIGQDDAVIAVSNSLRRCRAGVRNEKKPIASFLFFGPTGVGKTEVAKTLSRVFFGGEDHMLRFDMSEYSDNTSLVRLVGDMDGGVGSLVSTLREHPYGVLLLDEFEKAHSSVHDLFLQILDEGVFHDSDGMVVNCRNIIVIATSNAGASDIHIHVENNGKFSRDFERSVIDNIIKRGVFKPELLNRFDDNILFTPISNDDYRKIAEHMLKALSRRLSEQQGITLIVNDFLIDTIIKYGIDPAFGARPMQRAIQDIVEQRVAQKILNGEAGPGVSLEFREGDFI